MSELDILKKQKLKEYKERKRELDKSFGKMIVDFFSTSETKRKEKHEKHLLRLKNNPEYYERCKEKNKANYEKIKLKGKASPRPVPPSPTPPPSPSPSPPPSPIPQPKLPPSKLSRSISIRSLNLF